MSRPVASLRLFLCIGTLICLNPSTVGTSNLTDVLSTNDTNSNLLTNDNTTGLGPSSHSTDHASSRKVTKSPSKSPRDQPVTSTASGTKQTSVTMGMTHTMTDQQTVPKRTVCFPGFQCIHGHCLTEFSCECEEGWTGLFCQTKCPVCGPDAVCGMNPSGDAVCLCLDKSVRYHPEHGCLTGRDPTTTELPTAATIGDFLRPVAERECFPGFRCVHGYCQVGFLRCVCDGGWVGQFCHEACRLDCRGGGVCALNEAAVQYCDCFEDFFGANCELRRLPEPPRTADSMNTSQTTSPNDKGTTPNLTSTTPPPKTKECAPGFPCQHGVCVPGTIKCECDPGWQGYFCHKPVSELSKITLPKSTDTPNLLNFSSDNTIQHTDWTSIEGFGDLAASPLRNCSTGFTCRYGNCSKGPGIGCDCESGFTGVFCQDPCPLNCGENGQCQVDWTNKSEVFCECDFPYTGVNCSQIREIKTDEKESSNHWYAVGVAVAIFLILMLALVVLPYLLWRRRNITIMRIVFWLRNYEDDDGREYDAFVAYASNKNDRKFVLDELIPNLEERLSFSLCIHERDFLPGNYIATNINEAIRKSRRTLILVTPTFVRRKWCQFEFEVAVREMVEQKHRILPVILGDISEVKEEMSESLRHILSTVTYLEHPGMDAGEQELKKFWKKLELSMPKKQPKVASDFPATMSYSALTSSTSSSNLEINSQTNDMKISLSDCQPSSLSPIENDESSNRQFRRFVRLPVSCLDGDERRRNKGNLLSHLLGKFIRSKSFTNQTSSAKDNAREIALPQSLPGSLRRAERWGASASCSDFSSAMAPRGIQNSSISNELILKEVPRISRKRSEREKKYAVLENDALKPVEETPICQIAQNFLGNQSLRYSQRRDNLAYVF